MHSLPGKDHTGPLPELKLNVRRVIVWRAMYWLLIVADCFLIPECHTHTDNEISRGQESNAGSELTVQGKHERVGFGWGLDPTWRAKSSITAWGNLLCVKTTLKNLLCLSLIKGAHDFKFLKEIRVNIELFRTEQMPTKTRDGAVSPTSEIFSPLQ